jgi:AcrR family transcriptional regulator
MVRKPDPERREKFLSSALKLFAANGPQNTSTAAIAKEAGAAAGTLFLYFPTKQDLIHELILEIGKEQSIYIKSLLDPTLPVRETFLTIWNGSIHWFLDHPDAYQYVQQVQDSGLIEEAVVQESNKFFDYYYDAIQRGFEEGFIKPYPIDLIGGFLYQDILAVMNLLRTRPDPGGREETIQTGFDIFWDGIKRK